MKVSLSWLKDYVDIDMDTSALSDALTMAGLEVEAVFDRYEYLDTVYVGKITEVRPHPNADKLTVCRVHVGDRDVDVVCGAPNAREGLTSALAFPGTVLPDGSVLKTSAIRGVESHGMLCGEFELGLGDDRSGIMELSDSLSAGQPLASTLGLSDAVLEIGLTPNRPDCLSIVGIAREIAAIENKPLKVPDATITDTEDAITKLTSVTIEDPDHCNRYAARLLDNVTVTKSPFWLRDRLLSIGLRPINAIVDITNFVMMETGQPLHAFDFDLLAQNRIVVRTASEGESFTTLDGKQRRLGSEMLMIRDGEKPVAVGGVMGGENSEIQDNTRRVLIESAYFNPVSIRKTAKALTLGTDASHRFERGIDPEGTVKALDRAARLMAEVSGARIIDGLIDEHPIKTEPKNITLNAGQTNRLLGTNIEIDRMKTLLESIGLSVEKRDEENLHVQPPSFRVDIGRPQDLMEEIARLSGYDNIPTTIPMVPASERIPSHAWDLRGKIKDTMKGLGFSEAINYSFIEESARDFLRMPEGDPRRNLLYILNPLSEDQAVMRTSLIPGLLKNMRFNLSQQSRSLKLFEVGNTFISNGQESLPTETEYLAALWTGTRQEFSWHLPPTPCDFYDMKGAAEALLKAMDIPDAEFTSLAPEKCTHTRPGRTAQILVGQNQVGLIGEIHPDVAKAYDLKQTAFILELDISLLAGHIPETKQFRSVPRFPSTSRDITVIIDRHIEARNVFQLVYGMDHPLLESVVLFDVFEDDPIPKGKKSISLRLTYRSAEKTLEDSDVNPVTEQIANRLMEKLGASLPG